MLTINITAIIERARAETCPIKRAEVAEWLLAYPVKGADRTLLRLVARELQR